MKKFLVVFLAIAQVLVSTVSALAATTITAFGGSESTTVKGTYVSGGSATPVYSVDITWGSMEFTYTDADSGTWNPETHSYDGGAVASWSCEDGANVITVTNHSNVAVTADLSYEAATGYSGITGSFSDSSLNLPTAVGTTRENAPTKTATLTLSGALPSDTAANTQIGTVKVTLR